MGKRGGGGLRPLFPPGRVTIVGLVMARYVITSFVFVTIGDVVGVALVLRLTGVAPAADVVVAVSGLVLLSTAAATLPPAVVAAWRDPVRVLRVP